MLLFKLICLAIKSLRKPEDKDKPWTIEEAAALIKTRAETEHPGEDLDTTGLVDAMKAIDIDSSFKNRKKLASFLGLAETYEGTGKQNLWLRDRLIEKVAANDVDSLRD